MATVVWLFVALVITQSYTASLTSMLTVQRLEPRVADIATLKNSNAMIGYSTKSFIVNYLEDVLQFNPNNIKDLETTEGCAENLRNGKIAAVFLEVPVAKLFIAKYCKSFIMAGPTYKIGGSAFAFPKGSPMVSDINEALLNVFENGKLLELENNLAASEKCVDVESDHENISLSPSSFLVLFIISGVTSTAALAIYVIRGMWKLDNSMCQHISIWMLILLVMERWRHLKKHTSRKVSNVESPRNPPNSTSDFWTHV
ncbi:hypothetical protein F0562_010607 [Nyssa sinensis]|uniref:Ionotropic glutamate receptor C-terminal domain-containing protein n=1 Tax=Nyssa sinensis TaxID=561372 RepID=A0A5J5A2F3_9ASTE|nr:hypothetical protein F0562_010607 [Nyssa sinensis]